MWGIRLRGAMARHVAAYRFECVMEITGSKPGITGCGGERLYGIRCGVYPVLTDPKRFRVASAARYIVSISGELYTLLP